MSAVYALSGHALLLAQAAKKPQGNPLGQLVIFLPLIIVFYFLLMRPQQKARKQQAQLMREIKPGDKVLFAGGIQGTIRRVDDDSLSVQVADNVVLKIEKSSVSKVLNKV